MYIWPTLTFFALIPCVLSSHFRGGLLTWKAVNETQILVSHRVSYVFSYCSNPETTTLQCFSGCTGSVIMNANCTESNSTENWADFEGITKFDITNRTLTSVVLRFSSNAWMSLAHFSGSWSLIMTVDLSIRSDTGKINQSPVSTVASSMIFSRTCWLSNIPYIPVADFDGDNVRCRFASGSDECASICGNHVSFLTLNEANCSFTVNSNLGSTSIGDYAVALQIEDFTDSSSSIPLSSVPLQFIITVQQAGVCFDSAVFVSPTPAAGETLLAQNRSLQLNARAYVHYTKVTKFHIMSPLKFTMSDIVQHGLYEFEVTMSLDPNVEDLNGTYVMCFSAETSERISSESRCITVDLGDIDDCQTEPCQNNGSCTDLVNDYQCSCVAGFNGTNCENDINECTVQPCQNNGTCIDLINGYQCICAYRFNGTNCETINDSCPSDCQNNSTCIDMISHIHCQCVEGFNGTRCENNIDDCIPEPCQNNGTCTDLVNDYHCDCVGGFNETNCENNINDCQAEPCQNNGTCTDLVNDYRCDCVAGFNGTNCDNNINECLPNPCQNNGTCTDMVNDYKCDCVPGFNGTNCENDIDDCNSEPCQNNGTCTDLINDYQCDCVAGFNGTNCENNIDECQPLPCQNNGTCTDLVNDYQCSCVVGFNGTNCENNTDECASQPCQNNGTCTDLINGYQCNCTDGFNGTNCEIDMDECASEPCQNNGTCIDLINGYNCNCTYGFNGTDCEFDVDLCASFPCNNNGTCIDLTNRFQCQCPLEFNGTTCSTESYLTKFTIELKLDVTISEDLSSSTDYNTVKSKVYIALTEMYSTIPGSTVIIHSLRKGSLIVDFDLIIPDDPVSKVQVVDTVYKLVNGLAFVNYSGEVVNVTSASFNSSAGTVIITNSTDGCSIMNSQSVCSPGYRCHEFNNYTVACIPIITTTPNPCLEYRDARYLSDDCGNHSSTGYCAQSNSACLPSEDGLDWTCRCIHSHYNHNSSCVPVPSSLFEHKVMALGSLKSDRIVLLSQEDTNNSEHLFEFGDAVEDVNSNSSNCVIRTFNSGFNCSLNSSGIIVGVNKVLGSALYHVIVHVTLQIGSENAEVEDTLSILFEVQATQQNQTILIAEGTLKDTLITTVDLKVNDTNPSLQGNAHFLSMDSNGLVKTNQTTLLDTDFVSQMFTAIVYDNIFLNIVVYKMSHQISINENTNATVICKTDQRVDSALLQTKDYLLLLPDGSIVVKEPFDYEMIKEYMFELFGQVDDKNFTIKITLNILDLNDNPPVLDNNYMFTVTNSQLRAIVGVVPATDPDTVGVLNYSITDESGDSRFQIGSFGEVSMVNTRRGGNATVTVTDGVFYVNASVTVNVVSGETNDTHETFVFNCSIFENKDKGTSLCSVFKEGYVDYVFDHLSDRTKFNLNSTTGNITTNAPLDREDIDHYDYSVIAIQSKNPCKFATIRVKISVLDENDETPMFDQPVYKGKIRENANGTKVTLETPLKVTDKDLNSTFTFNISGTTFTISSTGEIFSSDETIDRETQSSYSLTVMVKDGKHANSSIVEISVEDENDNRPMALNMTFSVLEDAAEDTDIGQVFATDADIGINAQLIFTDAISGYFEVNTTGFLKVNRLLDRETNDEDAFTVRVCDSGRDISLCTRSWITVNITDVNEAPSFKYNKKVPVFRIPENSNCSSISDLTEFFLDGDLGVNRELDFSVLSESDTFHIDSNGKLFCPGLDYDDSLNKVYELTIKATDRGDPPLSTNGTIIIVVEDVNDNAPIPSADTHFEIVFYSGGCPNCSKLVALITATDKDSGSNGEIEFQAIGGDAKNFLKIENSSGLIEAPTNDMSLTNGTYLYIVNITDKGIQPLGTTVTLSFKVTVLLGSASDITQVFNKDKLLFNWTENDVFPSPFIAVKNFTKDPAMSIKTFFLPNYNLGDFYLNGSKQEFLYVNRTKHSTFFDRETQHQYRFIIQAKLPFYSMLAELTITIIDVNDNPPRFQSDIAQVALIKENATNGTSLNLTFDATDRDEGENAQIAYMISNENCDNVFQLNNSDSGNIVLIGKLDYEDKEYCNLTLTVFNPNNETMQSSVDVHIEIEDVNDNSPLFDQSVYHVSIKERVKDLAEEEVLVYINGLSVTDPDSRQFGKKSVRISIERPSECPLLVREHKVDNFVLMINQSMTLDYESTINFNCTLRATDGGNLSSTALLEIELLDINDNSPEADDVIEREIPRSSEIDYVIVSQINATDRDSGRNALLSFDFSTNDDGYSYFKIDATNGKISIAKNLTTLQLDSVELTVIVSDDGLPQPLSTSVMVKINITDDNERPVFSQAEYQKKVEENTKLEGVLMTVTAQDRKNEKLVECNCTYRLIDISDNSNDSYTIDGVTGDLIVNVSGYDREKEPFITLTVVAKDEGGKETSARVNITVLDQNDNDPKFLKDFQFEVYQEAPVGTCFGNVTADDKDEGMNAVTLYKIIRDSNTSSNYNDSVIVIKETTGELCSIESLNIGAVRDFTEHVRVEAIDKGDRNRRNRVTVSVIIKYKDTNQHPPAFIPVEQGDIEPISLKSRQTNIPVTTLSADDLDEGKDGEVEFSILEGNVLDMFTIDKDTGDLSFSSKITMIGSHPVHLTVQATDKGVHPKSSTLTLNLTLEGEKESYIADKVKSAEEFMTYTWSLVGVACFLILVTAAAVFGFCQSRIKAHRELDDDHRRTFNGLKHNVSYGVNMPQMHMLQQDWTDTNAQRRTRFRSDSTSFESSLDRYPPERDVSEEFDQRRSFKISVFDPSPERHAPAPQLPPPRESSGPLIPKPDYD